MSTKTFDTGEVLEGVSGPTSAGSSNTSLIFRCPKYYQYQIVRKISVPAARNPPQFTVGNVFGAMRQKWFARKFDTSAKTMRKCFDAATEEAEKAKLPCKPEDVAFGRLLFDQYVQHYSIRPKPRPLAVEYEMTAELGGAFESMRTAKPDDIGYYPEAGGALVMADAKTTSLDPGTLVREYELHVQPLQYFAVYRLAENGEAKWGPLKGLILDIVKKPDFKGGKDKKAKFYRPFIEYRQETVDEFVRSVTGYLTAASKIDWDSAPRRTYQCVKQYGRMLVDCPYKNLCRFGKSAAGGYVMENGRRLMTHKPEAGKESMPWE
jgi:hypothetical protein